MQIIRAHGRVFRDRGIPAAIKFQFRDLDHYQHGDAAYQEKFRASQLQDFEYDWLKQEARSCGFMVGATAFDPSSAKKLRGYDFAKIASCTGKSDRETCEAIADAGLPTIISTGGLDQEHVWAVAKWAVDERNLDFALMHCVSLYPCSEYRCDLSRLGWMQFCFASRDIPIGWSTHERPDATVPIQMAVAYGATIFERHIGLGNENAYTSSPVQIDKWVSAWVHAQGIAGCEDRQERSDELAALARVERKYGINARDWNSDHIIGTGEDNFNAPASPDSNRAALEGGDIPPSWAYGVHARGVLSDNLR